MVTMNLLGISDAQKGEEASLNNDPDVAGHEFELGAGRLEGY
jgi:hypothetical protein